MCVRNFARTRGGQSRVPALGLDEWKIEVTEGLLNSIPGAMALFVMHLLMMSHRIPYALA